MFFQPDFRDITTVKIEIHKVVKKGSIVVKRRDPQKAHLGPLLLVHT